MAASAGTCETTLAPGQDGSGESARHRTDVRPRERKLDRGPDSSRDVRPASAGRAPMGTLTDDIRAAAARVAREARQRPDRPRRDRGLRARAARRIAADARPRRRRRRDPRRVQPPAQRDQLRQRLVPDAQQAAGPVRLPHDRGRRCARAARGRRTELQTLTRDEVARTFGQDPDHVLMGLFARHLNALGEQVDGSFLAFARAHDDVEALATELASWDDLARRQPLPERRRPVLQARPDRRRRPRARRA